MTTLQHLERQLGALPLGPIVGGEAVGGPDVISVVDPATEEVITEIAAGDVATCLQAVDAAESAMRGWAAQTPRHRSDVLRRSSPRASTSPSSGRRTGSTAQSRICSGFSTISTNVRIHSAAVEPSIGR